MENIKRSPSTAKLLNELTPETATDWRTVGRILTSLEKSGRTSTDGEQWINVVRKKLTMLGHKVSAGHLHKVRRAYNFLKSSMEADRIPEKYASYAKISSIEIAERLYQLNSAEGSEALAACLNPKNPATAADIKKRYDNFVKRHPEKKNAMHAAWEQRKKSDEPHNRPEGAQKNTARSILVELQKYVSSLETGLSEKDANIETLEEELSEKRRLLAEVEHELSIVKDELKDLRMANSRS